MYEVDFEGEGVVGTTVLNQHIQEVMQPNTNMR